MDITAIDTEINEQIQRLQDLNKQMGEIAGKIGALQEEGKALHSAALEVKGAIEGLAKLKMKEEAKAKELKDKLTLPDHSLVAPDGKTVIADANKPTANLAGADQTPGADRIVAPAATPETPKAPASPIQHDAAAGERSVTPLEVVK